MWSNTHNFDRYFIGLDRVMDRVAAMAQETQKAVSNYPPYNLKKIDDNKYVIEMAVAGFSKHDIEIEIIDDKLTIKGNAEADTDFDPEGADSMYAMIYQGLAMRPFTRTFTLADNVEIKGASLLNGILKIGLEALIPEHKKPKKVEIKDEEETSSAPLTAEFLAERKDK
jgi:molecular chaperone IbpA